MVLKKNAFITRWCYKWVKTFPEGNLAKCIKLVSCAQTNQNDNTLAEQGIGF